MARKPFLIRVDAKVLAAIQRWADDDLRSLNGQIEWLLRQALQKASRLAPADEPAGELPNRRTEQVLEERET